MRWGFVMVRRKRELTTEEKILIRTQITDEEAWSKFEHDCSLRNLRNATVKYYKNEISAFQKSMAELNIEKQFIDLTKSEIEEVLLHLKKQLKIVSINTRIRALKAYFNFLDKNKIISINPMKEIKQMRNRQRIIETLDDREIEKIASTIRNEKSFVGVRDITIFMVMLDTGIRLSELTGIQLEDLRDNELIIRETKNLLQRTVYLSMRTQQQIKVYLRLRGKVTSNYLFINEYDRQLKNRGIQNRFEKYKKLANIEKQFSPHILRHTYAKHMILRGMDAFSLATLLGHSDLSVTKRYVALWGNDLEEKAKKFSTINKLKL